MRKICVVTGSRADYGLLYWLLKEIQTDERVKLQLVVTGAHLVPEVGMTVEAIEADGFKPDAKVDMLLSSGSTVGVAKSVGIGVIGFADVLNRLAPDLLVILGDRFEILAAAQAAMIARIPIAHIHGGELTEGAIDDVIRHSLTKMSHLHFVTADSYRERVIQLGEVPERVWNFGAPGLEAFRRTTMLSRNELSHSLGFDLRDPYFLVTYHPETLSMMNREATDALFRALAEFPEHRVIVTGVNSDPDNHLVRDAINAFLAANNGMVYFVENLGQQRYLSALKYAAVVVGNSSSGLIEAPSAGVPTVNIGQRQRGRIKVSSVIDASENTDSIVNAIRAALSPDFQDVLEKVASPFGDGHVAARILNVLAEHTLDGITAKEFHDIR
jgi:UDP-hydrolysing UDP-N-acetyl-D-glucosamine 2-epimerase